MAIKSSRPVGVSVRSDEVGRPRKNPESEDQILSFRVNRELRDTLDEVVTRTNAAQPGRSMSRTELIKIVLYDWMKRGAKVPK